MWEKLYSNSGLILLAVLGAGIWTSNALSFFALKNAPQVDAVAAPSPSPTPQLSCVELYQQRKDKEFIERCSLQERLDIYDVMSKVKVELSKRAQAPRATAICADGTYSYSASRRGTCSQQKIQLFSIPSEVSFGNLTVMQWYPHWQYFLAIEADTENTTRYVQPTRDNFKTYSIEFARILLSAGSEIDVVAQLLCRKLDAGSKANKIHLYREQIIAKYPLFTTMRVVVPRYGFFLEPWRDWERGETPLWWRSYNNVKHERDAHFSDANLDNVLWAVAGLFCLVLYFYQPALYANELKPWTRLFALPKEPGYRMLEQNYGLPDFG